MKRLPGVTEIYEVRETSDHPIPCGHCGDDIRSEVIDEGSHEDAHRRWSIALDVHCHCGAINLFYCHWTPYLVERDGVDLTDVDDPREEALTASERNPGLK